jgi:hypothetical protein
VAERDHPAGGDADVVGGDAQVVPHLGGVGEVLAHAVVAAVGLRAALARRRADRVEHDVGRDVLQGGLEVAAGERVVDRADRVGLVRPRSGLP